MGGGNHIEIFQHALLACGAKFKAQAALNCIVGVHYLQQISDNFNFGQNMYQKI